jgi:hypothetical protein
MAVGAKRLIPGWMGAGVLLPGAWSRFSWPLASLGRRRWHYLIFCLSVGICRDQCNYNAASNMVCELRPPSTWVISGAAIRYGIGEPVRCGLRTRGPK